MKKILALSICVLLIVPLSALALEVDFPEIEGVKPGEAFGPASWINYLFVFGLAIVGLVIIGNLVRAGIEWMVGAESPGKISDARSRILSSIVGLIILLGSYVFLRTIDPALVRLKNPQIDFTIEGHWRDHYKPAEADITATKIIGRECSKSEECMSGNCEDGKCSQSAPPGNMNGRCLEENKCDQGLICDGEFCVLPGI